MIKVKEIHFRYNPGEPMALEDISMEIRKGEYVALIGPNGCGKTTLIRHLNGLLLPVKGKILVDGIDTGDPVAVQDIRQRVGMVFQNPDNQIVGMTVEEDVSFGPGNLGLPPPEIRERVKKSLEIVGLKKHAKRLPHSLSSGEKQLVAVAGVLAMDPQYIILDEPTAYLDPSGQKRVLDVIKRLHRHGIAIIHVTHDMDEIVVADQIFVMNKGKIILNERPADVFTRSGWLKELGLDIPAVTELMLQLRQMGTDVRPDILTLDEACAELSALLKSNTSR